MEAPRVMLVGAPGAGKSVAACTISKHTPENFPDHEGMAVLEDVVYVQLEPGATKSLASVGLEVPRVIDVGDATTAKSPKNSELNINALQDTIIEVFEYIEENVEPHEFVVFDSISTLDMLTSSYFGRKYGDKAYQDYKLNNAWHGSIVQGLKSLHCGYVLVSHAKVAAPIDNADSKAHKDAKAKAESSAGKRMPGDLDITGAAKNLYIRQVDEILPIGVQSVRKGKELVRQRVIHPFGNDVLAGKTRFEKAVDAVEPANLRQFYNKIEVYLRGLE
ncbi:MAG: AAA family ATPase [Cyanobacteria bacterium J06635_11]